MSVVCALAVLTVGIGVAAAHPGHGEFGEGGTVRHFLTEPLHLLLWLPLVLLAVSAAIGRRRRNARRS